MKSSIGQDSSVFELGSKNKSYDWHYIDALSADGEWMVVAILFDGMAMSPDYISAIADSRKTAQTIDRSCYSGHSISILHRGKRVAFSFVHEPLLDWSVTMEKTEIRTPTIHFIRSKNEVTVEIDTRGIEHRRSTHFTIHLRHTDRPASHLHLLEEEFGASQEHHFWDVIRPRFTASLKLELFESGRSIVTKNVEVQCYHDRNFGDSHLHQSFGDWMWFRAHFQTMTLVYLQSASTESGSHSSIEQHLFVIHGECVERLSIHGFRVCEYGFSPLLQRYPKVVEIQTHSSTLGELSIVLSNSSIVERSPFYLRFLAKCSIDVNGATEVTEQCISEVMKTHRLDSKFVHPFLRLPLLYY